MEEEGVTMGRLFFTNSLILKRWVQRTTSVLLGEIRYEVGRTHRVPKG
ncbi:MAG: hypothetical protein ACI9XO_000068 [Paraglaciecola sp.]|jgi:hypothetical protein